MSVTPTPDAEAAYAHLKALLLPLASPEVHLVGIYSGGVWVAQRLHQDLSWPSPLGLISSTLLARLVTPVMYKLMPPEGHEPRNLRRGDAPEASGALL